MQTYNVGQLNAAFLSARLTARKNARGAELERRLAKLAEWYDYHYAKIIAAILIDRWKRFYTRR